MKGPACAKQDSIQCYLTTKYAQRVQARRAALNQEDLLFKGKYWQSNDCRDQGSPRNPGLLGPYQKAAPDAPFPAPLTWALALLAVFFTAFCAFLIGRGFFAASTTVLICNTISA